MHWLWHRTDVASRRREHDTVDLTLRLSAIIVLLRPTGDWTTRVGLLAVASLALMFPRVLRSRAAWLVTGGLVTTSITAAWPLADNHLYLLAYWCLAIALALGTKDTGATLATSGRLLLGCAFLFAVIWKGLLSPDFVDGRFFRVTLMTDPRFEDAARLIGRLSADALAESRTSLAALPAGAEWLERPELLADARLRIFASVLTLGALVSEGMVAVLCLWPQPDRVATVRHLFILAFCATTYALAPVSGFGWLLAVIGLATCQPRERAFRIAYAGAFLLVLAYEEVPWAALALDEWAGNPDAAAAYRASP
jgi:hypothetical protein